MAEVEEAVFISSQLPFLVAAWSLKHCTGKGVGNRERLARRNSETAASCYLPGLTLWGQYVLYFPFPFALSPHEKQAPAQGCFSSRREPSCDTDGQQCGPHTSYRKWPRNGRSKGKNAPHRAAEIDRLGWYPRSRQVGPAVCLARRPLFSRLAQLLPTAGL